MVTTSSNKDKLVYYSLLIYGFIVLAPFFTAFRILSVNYNYSYLFNFATLLAGFAAISSLNKTSGRGIVLLNIFLVLFLFMVINGVVVQKNLPGILLDEIIVYIRFYIFLLLGYQFTSYHYFRKAIFIWLWVGFIANLISLFTVSSFLRAEIDEKTLTYMLQYLLIPSALYLFFYSKLKRHEKIIVILSFALYFVEQLLFQKRLPMARIFVTLLFFYYASTTIAAQRVFTSIFLKRIIGLIMGVFAIAMILFFSGSSMGTYTEALFARFFQYGTATETVMQDARWKIGEIIVTDIVETGDVYLGRGLGSVVYDESFQNINLSSKFAGARSASEMGVPTILLKGGYVLLCYFLLLFFVLLKKFKTVKTNSDMFGLWSFVIIWFIFVYGEGFLSGISTEIIVAYCIGALLASRKTIHYFN